MGSTVTIYLDVRKGSGGTPTPRKGRSSMGGGGAGEGVAGGGGGGGGGGAGAGGGAQQGYDDDTSVVLDSPTGDPMAEPAAGAEDAAALAVGRCSLNLL